MYRNASDRQLTPWHKALVADMRIQPTLESGELQRTKLRLCCCEFARGHPQSTDLLIKMKAIVFSSKLAYAVRSRVPRARVRV